MADESKYATRIAPYGLRMPPDLKARVEASAEKNKRSLNAEIVATLEKAYPEPLAIRNLEIMRIILRSDPDTKNALVEALRNATTDQDSDLGKSQAELLTLLEAFADAITEDEQQEIEKKLDIVRERIRESSDE